MSDTAVRFVVLVAVIVTAVVIAAVMNRLRTPPHPTVRVDPSLGDRPGVVLFTSTRCTTCKDTIAFLEAQGVPFREVTEELEGTKFEDAGVVAVPVTAVLDASGATVQTFAGVPRKSSFRSALAKAGIDA